MKTRERKQEAHKYIEDTNELIASYERFNFRCALTDSEDVHYEHWIPQSIGGESSIRNCYPLDATLNIRKGAANPFEFFRRKDIHAKIDRERFDELVFWLAIVNDMTVQEFEDYTNQKYEELRSKRCDESL